MTQTRPSPAGTPPRLPGLHHAAVVVSDLARAEAFYVGVLGLTVLTRHADDAGRQRSIWLDLGGGAFLAVERSGVKGPARDDRAPGWHCLVLGIAPGDRAGWYERFLQEGVTVVRESEYTLYVRDPDGNILGLSHYPHPQVNNSEESSWR